MAHILIAEHNNTTSEYLTQSLRKNGHRITSVNNCLDAWRAASHNDFDILVVDIVMPGMDGFVLAQRALQENPYLQVIFVTGFAGVVMDVAATPAYAPAPITSRPFHLRDTNTQVGYLLGFGVPQEHKNTRTATANNVVYANFDSTNMQQQTIGS